MTLSIFADALGIELLPLQPDALRAIFGAMRLGGYASAETYVATARIAHVSAGFPLGDDLKLFLRGAERAMVRGRGPSSKAATFDLRDLVCSDLNVVWWTQSSIGDGPGLPWASLVVSVWWMLRTIELVWVNIQNVRIHTKPLRAELRLGITKTDICGVGKSRIYECACTASGGDLASTICPACILVRAVEARRDAWGC